MIHWCGTGLSAIPGLRRLLEAEYEVTVWNRSREKAEAAVGDLTDRVRGFDLGALEGELAAGDVVVSMLPADLHLALAQLCIDAGSHFVSSSYISEAMAGLDADAKAAGVCLVNEVGLDPGIDHLMAHDLVARYRASDAYDQTNTISFHSYCGGVPAEANAFRYKFSWSPLGVLRALRSPARALHDFQESVVRRPWEGVTHYLAPLPQPEQFEVYPNRDSMPFLAAYGMDGWRVRDFVRGTLRLGGWAKAWAPIFAEVETADEAALAARADALWREHAYGPGEADRVVLIVDLKAERNGRPVWHRTWLLDAQGDARGSAMARLVSVPVSLAVEAVLGGGLEPGVQAAPDDPEIVERWLTAIAPLAQHMARVTG